MYHRLLRLRLTHAQMDKAVKNAISLYILRLTHADTWQMDKAAKNAISHRYRALALLKERLLQNPPPADG